MNDIQLPIEHISYSAMREYCNNRWLFKKHYILNDWSDINSSVVGMAGKGFHKVIENYLTGAPIEQAIQKGIQEIESVPDKDIDFGKTGSREDIVKQMTAGVNFYLAELPNFGEILATEEKIVTDFDFDGQLSPLPVKAVSDVIGKLNGGIHIHDHKLVAAFNDLDEEKPDYIMQAIFNYITVSAKYKEKPVAMHFHEVKKSKNKDGSAQVQTYTIEFDKHPEYMKYFNKMYTGLIIELTSDNTQFLPNFGDYFGGKEAWKDFTGELMDFNLPKQVTHKASYVTNIDRTAPIRNFVESAADTTPQGQIIAKMQEFAMPLEYVESHEGANATLYTFKPSRGVSMKKLSAYEDDVALAMGAESVRIQAPIKGTKFVGFEVSSTDQKTIEWSESLLEKGTLMIPVGRSVFGEDAKINLVKAPHLLVAGATGAGKSVFLSSLIQTVIQQNSEADLGLVLIDPKKTEFSNFDSSTHLEADILTEVDEIHTTLEWLVQEMNDRYNQMKGAKAKNIDEFNKSGSMKKLVVVIDELADLLLSSDKLPNTVEKYSTQMGKNIIRLAQKSRAAGIHLVVATQRPSTDVVTGILKANFPARVAFRTSTSVDSQVILDQTGAEKLIGNGDLLLLDPRQQDLVRLQGYYI